MTDSILQKFHPYYKVEFLVKGNDASSSYFSIPADINNKKEVGKMAVNIEIVKSQQGILSSLGLKIYNLNENHRNMLFHEPYWNNTKEIINNYKRVYLEIGYLTYDKGETHLTWQGTIQNASSYKEDTNIVTEIVANQLGYINDVSKIQLYIDEGESVSDVLSNKLTNFILDAQYSNELEKDARARAGRDVSKFFPENTFSIECDFQNDYIFDYRAVIDDLKLFEALKVISSFVPNSRIFFKDNSICVTDKQDNNSSNTITISPETGLRSTPRIFGSRITLTTMFEPKLNMNTSVNVKSVILPNVNDEYAVVGYSHKLTLGDGTTPSAITEANLVRKDMIKE